MPKPAVRESMLSGRISPKSNSLVADPGAGADVLGPLGEVSGETTREAMGSGVFVLDDEVAFLGLPIRLAKDWALLETVSSATNLGRWLLLAPRGLGLLEGSFPRCSREPGDVAAAAGVVVLGVE